MNSPNAPSVSYPVGRSRFLAGLLVAAWWFAAVVTLLWWLGAAPSDRGPWLGLGALLLSALALRMCWRRMPVGQLQWDGQDWTWQSAGYPGSTSVSAPQVLLDAQRLLLIRLQNQAGASWLLWADAASEPKRWLHLRRAVHARPHNASMAISPAERRAQP